ncbi:hypothetical protein C4885_14770 [Subdoligranulum sp. APC924/74]|jgi:hypothetical protein|nr:hypothetical protein C4885_14770 [Subdoligranulum sp. APC924/74]HCR08167.1 hypothetical protein [Oscillospiraceae bacterium]
MYLPGAIAVVLICPHCNPGKPRRQAKLFIFCQNVQFAQRSPFCSSARLCNLHFLPGCQLYSAWCFARKFTFFIVKTRFHNIFVTFFQNPLPKIEPLCYNKTILG